MVDGWWLVVDGWCLMGRDSMVVGRLVTYSEPNLRQNIQLPTCYYLFSYR
jgi:hypothetical protein